MKELGSSSAVLNIAKRQDYNKGRLIKGVEYEIRYNRAPYCHSKKRRQ
jgi:hypothetical protein